MCGRGCIHVVVVFMTRQHVQPNYCVVRENRFCLDSGECGIDCGMGAYGGTLAYGFPSPALPVHTHTHILARARMPVEFAFQVRVLTDTNAHTKSDT